MLTQTLSALGFDQAAFPKSTAPISGHTQNSGQAEPRSGPSKHLDADQPRTLSPSMPKFRQVYVLLDTEDNESSEGEAREFAVDDEQINVLLNADS